MQILLLANAFITEIIVMTGKVLIRLFKRFEMLSYSYRRNVQEQYIQDAFAPALSWKEEPLADFLYLYGQKFLYLSLSNIASRSSRKLQVRRRFSSSDDFLTDIEGEAL